MEFKVMEKESKKGNRYVGLFLIYDKKEYLIQFLYLVKQKGVLFVSALVTALQNILDTDAMLANLTTLIPVIGGLILFVFTFRIVRRMITGASKGKAKI